MRSEKTFVDLVPPRRCLSRDGGRSFPPKYSVGRWPRGRFHWWQIRLGFAPILPRRDPVVRCLMSLPWSYYLIRAEPHALRSVLVAGGMLTRSTLLAPTLAVSQCIFSALVVADPNDLIHVRKKNLSVTNFAGAGGGRNCLHDFFNHGVGDHQLKLDLRNEIDSVFPSAVELGVSLLPSMAAGLKHGHAFDSDLVQRILYAFQLGDLDDGFDFGHRNYCQSYAKTSEAGILVTSSRSVAVSPIRISSHLATGGRVPVQVLPACRRRK